MYGGFILMVIVALIALSPVIWFVWWQLAELGEPANHRRRAL